MRNPLSGQRRVGPTAPGGPGTEQQALAPVGEVVAESQGANGPEVAKEEVGGYVVGAQPAVVRGPAPGLASLLEPGQPGLGARPLAQANPAKTSPGATGKVTIPIAAAGLQGAARAEQGTDSPII